jgi:hypothetical protein
LKTAVSKKNDITIKGNRDMFGEKRFGMGPIPNSPECYINEKQVYGMSILRKFGWQLVCIRRPSLSEITTIFKNSQEKRVGVLDKDGILKISNDLKIRGSAI